MPKRSFFSSREHSGLHAGKIIAVLLVVVGKRKKTEQIMIFFFEVCWCSNELDLSVCERFRKTSSSSCSSFLLFFFFFTLFDLLLLCAFGAKDGNGTKKGDHSLEQRIPKERRRRKASPNKKKIFFSKEMCFMLVLQPISYSSGRMAKKKIVSCPHKSSNFWVLFNFLDAACKKKRERDCFQSLGNGGMSKKKRKKDDERKMAATRPPSQIFSHL